MAADESVERGEREGGAVALARGVAEAQLPVCEGESEGELESVEQAEMVEGKEGVGVRVAAVPGESVGASAVSVGRGEAVRAGEGVAAWGGEGVAAAAGLSEGSNGEVVGVWEAEGQDVWEECPREGVGGADAVPA